MDDFEKLIINYCDRKIENSKEQLDLFKNNLQNQSPLYAFTWSEYLIEQLAIAEVCELLKALIKNESSTLNPKKYLTRKFIVEMSSSSRCTSAMADLVNKMRIKALATVLEHNDEMLNLLYTEEK